MARGLIIAIGLDDFMASFAVDQIKPDHVAFLATEATLPHVTSLVASAGIRSYKICYIKDIFSTSETIQEFLNAFQWMKERGGVSEVMIDATNCITVVEMSTYVSASLIDLYREVLGETIELKLVYVHAQYAPTEYGAHVEVRGSERLVELEKPVDSLSFVLAFEAIRSFNHGRYEQARENFSMLLRNATGEKSLLYEALAALAEGYHRWDKLAFKEAAESLEQSAQLFTKVSKFGAVPELLSGIRAQHKVTGACARGDALEIIADLAANASRRDRDGRFDDALARLYACAERAVHHRLQIHGIDAARPDYSKLPAGVAEQFAKQQRGVLPEELELKRAALLLSLLDDPMGKEIQRIGYKTFTGLLGLRNQSLLAHGIQPVSEEHYRAFSTKLFAPLWNAFCEASNLSSERRSAHEHLSIAELASVFYRAGAGRELVVPAPRPAAVH